MGDVFAFEFLNALAFSAVVAISSRLLMVVAVAGRVEEDEAVEATLRPKRKGTSFWRDRNEVWTACLVGILRTIFSLIKYEDRFLKR